MSKNVIFLINKSEITAGTRGASLGPEAIIAAARKNESPIFGENEVQQLQNVNYFLDQSTSFRFAKRIDGLVSVYKELNSSVSGILNNHSFPIVLAADHGSAGGTIAGIKTAFPQKRLGVIWIDAHADIHTPYTTPSGNMHGMPLATALNEDNIECKRNDVDAETISLWNQLKSIGNSAPKIKPEDIVYIAVRDTEDQENRILDRLGIQKIDVAEIRQKSVQAMMPIIEEKLKDCDIIYVSFDVDSMDPDLTSYGTGTPVKNGLKPEEAKEILISLANNPKTVCIEVVEVNPCLDEKENKMAEITFDIVEEITKTLKK
ncbi:arginase [Flavobacterium sp. GT3R68]|uniref:arginase n=1 Tax=Flavobacterium sp. GT3R68 TaxID=2594437 RepID=UPI000F88729D|nr:arginase [Flavobacterium sp. GT3R68]RTY92313.1 arginase [Flavobacterium sp. GSN2]TRW92548.1 arginase [Flavobacterium sp. GT3R68]